MIVFCDKLMPRVLKVSCSSDWNIEIEQHINESVSVLKSIMAKAEYQFILLFVLNGKIPPFSAIIKIVSNLVLLYDDLRVSIDFIIIYCNNEDSLKIIQKILTSYEPARPIKIARTKEEILDLINEKECKE
jgi:hypothetical protein